MRRGGGGRFGTLGNLGGGGASQAGGHGHGDDDDDDDDDDSLPQEERESWFAGGERRCVIFLCV